MIRLIFYKKLIKLIQTCMFPVHAFFHADKNLHMYRYLTIWLCKNNVFHFLSFFSGKFYFQSSFYGSDHFIYEISYMKPIYDYGGIFKELSCYFDHSIRHIYCYLFYIIPLFLSKELLKLFYSTGRIYSLNNRGYFMYSPFIWIWEYSTVFIVRILFIQIKNLS